MDRVTRAVAFLEEAHRNGAPYENLPRAFAPSDLAEAYAIQRAFHERLKPRYGEIVGWKIAVTTPAMRRILAVPRPVVGAIFGKRVFRAPVTLPIRDFVHAGLEFEIAVELGRDLPPRAPPYTEDEVLPAVAAAYPAFELVDDRFADYTATEGTSLCADNAWNAGVVLGSRVAPPPAASLRSARGCVIFDGRDLGTGTSTPLASLAWLANELNALGFPVRQGMLIMTGSLVATQYPAAGSSAVFSSDGLGEVSIAFS